MVIQTAINRISQNYPAIPKIPTVDGIYGSRTEAAVRALQQIFGLTPDGVVGPATWYQIVRLYTAVTSLSELRSQGQRFYAIEWAAPNSLQTGDTGEKVQFLQYMLQVLSSFIPEIPSVAIDGIYGSATRSAVLAVQRRFRLPETGNVDSATWDRIYEQYSGIETTALRSTETFPINEQQQPANVRQAGNFRRTVPQNSNRQYNKTTTITQFPGRDISSGSQDPIKQEVVR